MKKIASIAVAGAMLLSMMPVQAAEDTTETTDATSSQNGEIWASVSADPLKQLKVTLPIKIEFAVTPGSSGSDKKVTYGDYKIRVDKDSDTGVQLDKVYVKSVDGGEWKLNSDADATRALNGTEDLKTVAINLAGAQLDYADNAIMNFKVATAGEKSLGLDIVTSATAIPAGTKAKTEKAFDVVYTISQAD